MDFLQEINRVFFSLSQLKVSLLLISFHSPVIFKEHITKLSTLEIFDITQKRLEMDLGC